MDKIVYLLAIVVMFSCKTNSLAQEKEPEKKQVSKTEKPNVKKQIFAGIQNPIDPGTVHLTGSVLKTSKDNSICGKPYKATITVKVSNVKGSGSGIVNMISAGQEITFGISKYMAKDFDSLKQKFAKDQQLYFVVVEGLCMDMSQTVYVVSSFKGDE